MISSVDKRERNQAPVVVVDIGNSSTAIGTWSDHKIEGSQSFGRDETGRLEDALRALSGESPEGFLSAVVLVSVVPDALNHLCEWVEKELNLDPLVVGRQIPLPLKTAMRDPSTVGVDRICCAAAAHERKKEACVVVDFGTAITVDAVDDGGSFMGGAILPGLRMQAAALHERTAALPEVVPEWPDEIIGGDTRQAIRSGICYGTAGAVRSVVEAFASHLGRWPPAVATGGDAALIAKECNIFDVIVPDLCLIGAGLAYDKQIGEAVRL